jgi:hypothetical protein
MAARPGPAGLPKGQQLAWMVKSSLRLTPRIGLEKQQFPSIPPTGMHGTNLLAELSRI